MQFALLHERDLGHAFYSGPALLTLALIMSPADVAAYELSIAVQKGDSVGGRVITVSDGELPGPKMNNLGEFAFSAGLDGVNAWSVLTNTGKVLLEPGQIIDGHTTNGVGDEDFAFGINDAGRVVFTEIVGLGGTIMLDDTPVVRPDSQIAGVDISGASAIGFVDYDIPINDHGQILFEARHGQSTDALFTLDELIASAGDIVDTGNGETAVIQRFHSGAIGNSGLVYYSARLDDGLGAPESEFSAIVGDEVDGKTISRIHPYGHPTITNRGDIAFLASFDDGTFGIVLATVPEPASVHLVLVAGIVGLLCLHRRNGFS